jgi:hypothetical protein
MLFSVVNRVRKRIPIRAMIVRAPTARGCPSGDARDICTGYRNRGRRAG